MSELNAQPTEPVATYRRRIPVSLERMIENALDWEHLPWLHASSFEKISLLSEDNDHWQCIARLTGTSADTLLELRLHEDRMGWATRTLEGAGAGTWIDSRVILHGEREIEVVVKFHVPGLALQEERDAVGALYLSLYKQLYDEDESMMVGRQQRLDEHRSGDVDPEGLGSLEDLRAQLPMTLKTHRGRFRVVEVEGRFVVHAALCPHSLGPLEQAPCRGDQGRLEVRCPWHGYRFDLETGVSCDGRSLKLAKPPRLEVDERGQVKLAW